MKWSTVLVVGSIGMRAGFVQVTPSAEVLKTRSFEEQFVRKRQSAQTTYTVPLASISADGSRPLRRPPASVRSVIEETVTVLLQFAPPSLDEHASIDPKTPRVIGTMTFPVGCTSGWPPIP